MSDSKFSGAKGNCSNEIGDHGDVQNHGLVNNQILDLHQSNHSVGAVINAENASSLPRSCQPSNRKLRKRKVVMKDFAKYKKNMDNKCKCLESANTSLENENVFLKNRVASLKRNLKRQKKMLDYSKEKYNELTDKTTFLSMHLLTQSNSQ